MTNMKIFPLNSLPIMHLTAAIFIVCGLSIHAQQHPCEMMGSEQGTILDCSNKNLDTFPTGLPDDTVELDLSNNPISVIPRASTYLPNLRTLKMENCQLDALSSDTFYGMSNLQTIILTGNQIQDIAIDTFVFNTQLETVYLNRNLLRTMNQNMFNGMNLALLHLGSNQLESLPDATFAFATISSIILDNNTLTELSELLLRPVKPSLEYFDLMNNRAVLEIEPDAFKDMRLKKLALSNSNIVDTSFLQYTSSNHLDLSHNTMLDLKQVSTSTLFTSAEFLYLKNISLQHVDATGFMLNFRNVRYLDISYNKLIMFPASSLSHISTLEDINFSHNELQMIPPDIGIILPDIRDLNFEYNHIAMIFKNDMANLLTLKSLNLEYNLIQMLDKDLMESFEKIGVLKFTGNPLHCNCEMRWFREWLDNRVSFLGIEDCFSPEKIYIYNLQPKDFKCTPPEITFMDTDTIIKEGEDLFLTCVAQADPAPEVEWKSPFGDIVSITPPQNRTQYKTRAVWHLSRINMFQAGVYSCTAKNIQQTITRSIVVEVTSEDLPTTPTTATVKTTVTTTTSTTPTTPTAQTSTVSPTTTASSTSTTTSSMTTSNIPSTSTPMLSTAETSSQIPVTERGGKSAATPEPPFLDSYVIVIIAVVVGVIVLIILLIVVACIFRRRKHFRRYDIGNPYDAKHITIHNGSPPYQNGHLPQKEKLTNGNTNMISSV